MVQRNEDNNDSDEKSKKRLFSSGNPKLQNYLQEKTKEKGQDTGSEIVVGMVPVNLYNNPILIEVQRKLVNEIDSSVVRRFQNDGELRKHIEYVLNHLCEREFPTLTNKERNIVLQAFMDEFVGLGPLQNLVVDESISEIMVNGPNQVYVEKNGMLKLTDIKFRDDEHVIQIIDKIVAPLGRRIDESSPMVDARLPNGSRVNAIIPPVSLKGPSLTIRKFAAIPLTIDKLVTYGTLNEAMAKFLEKAVLAKANIMVAGGTGSGKTTFLNVLSSFIPHGERIVTIEDAAELQLQQPHIVSLEARPANIEGKGEITIRDLVRNSLRMRPDRIIIGEVRGAEAIDMLQAMNTGHNGSLSTIHANSSRDAITRLETMVLYSGIDFPLRAIREQITSAIHLIVYTARLSDGSRKVTQIAEVVGMEGEIIVLQDIFYFEKNGKGNGKIRGEFKKTSIRPRICEKFESLGMSE